MLSMQPPIFTKGIPSAQNVRSVNDTFEIRNTTTTIHEPPPALQTESRPEKFSVYRLIMPQTGT